MSIINTLNRPVSITGRGGDHITSSRPMTDSEITDLQKELDLMKENTRIAWLSYKTYIPSFICAAVAFWVFRQIAPAFVCSVVFFIFINVIPYLAKGDSTLIKKDISGGSVGIRTGPVRVIEDRFNNIYMKRLYVDDLIIDGIYSKDGALKYPDLVDGQSIEVTYSPNAGHIFSVKVL